MKVFCSRCRQLVEQRDYGRHSARHKQQSRPPQPWKRGRRWMALRKQTIELLGPRCWGCGAETPPEELDLDHRLPRADGGPDEPYNVQPLCKRCHRAKHRG
jgi:5-methylcytosine-specific restriction endonuclease McrA